MNYFIVTTGGKGSIGNSGSEAPPEDWARMLKELADAADARSACVIAKDETAVSDAHIEALRATGLDQGEEPAEEGDEDYFLMFSGDDKILSLEEARDPDGLTVWTLSQGALTIQVASQEQAAEALAEIRGLGQAHEDWERHAEMGIVVMSLQ